MPIRPTYAEVNLSALAHNFDVIKQHTGGGAICQVIKADAYGHGAIPVAKKLESCGVDWLAVALVEEGIELRNAGIEPPFLVLGGGRGGFAEILEHRLVPTLWSVQQLDEYAAMAEKLEIKQAHFHLKIDTGMLRLGLQFSQLPDLIAELKNYPGVVLQGVMTHFANADLGNMKKTKQQLKTFENSVDILDASGFSPQFIHVSNSAAVMTFNEAHLELVRPGLMLYGLDPLPEERSAKMEMSLRPVLSLKSAILNLQKAAKDQTVSYGGLWVAPKDSLIATVPIGYADGYARILGNRAEVLIQGQRAKVVGAVCMDLIMVDVTDIPNVQLDDEVVLFGRQLDDEIPASELAQKAETIVYEIVTRLGPRIPRTYIEDTP